MVEAVEGAWIEASSRCSSSLTQQLLAEDSSRTVRRMTMVDGAVCDLGHAQNRGGDGPGCSKCRVQIRGGDDVFLQELVKVSCVVLKMATGWVGVGWRIRGPAPET